MENQAKKVNQSIDDFIKAAIDSAAEAKKKAAAECFKRVMKKSPVWSGQYVKSHRVGIGKIDKRAGKSKTAIGSKMSEVEAEILKSELNEFETRILLGKTVPIDQTIYISNSISHASDIEYTGWPSGKSPYHVYGLTAEEMRMRLSSILKLAVSKNAKLNKK